MWRKTHPSSIVVCVFSLLLRVFSAGSNPERAEWVWQRGKERGEEGKVRNSLVLRA